MDGWISLNETPDQAMMKLEAAKTYHLQVCGR
jgi:hypothetical protein